MKAEDLLINLLLSFYFKYSSISEGNTESFMSILLVT